MPRDNNGLALAMEGFHIIKIKKLFPSGLMASGDDRQAGSCARWPPGSSGSKCK